MRLVAPDRSWMGSPVTAGTANAEFTRDWLVDGRPNFPVQAASFNFTVTPAAAVSVDVVAVWGHNIEQGATITLGGSLTGTIPTAPWRRDGIPYGWLKLYPTPISVTSATIAVTGNTVAPVVAEFYGGLSFTGIGFLMDADFDPGEPFEWEGEGLGMNPYTPGMSKPRRHHGTIIATPAQFDDFVGLDESARRGSKPILYVPNDAVNDAWLVQLRWTARHNEGFYFIDCEILEVSRPEWP